MSESNYTYISGSSILLDNSTYFSFKNLIAGGVIDGDSLFNSASFAECLLLTDRIVTTPSVLWAPDDSDPLFGDDRSIRQFSANELTDEELRELFSLAIKGSLHDIRHNRNIIQLKSDAASFKSANDFLETWKDLSAADPRGFLTTYSGLVYYTDEASKAILLKIHKTRSEDATASRDLAQYLLRTNVAIELSSMYGPTPIPYHPHSFRTSYVLEKIVRSNIHARSIAQALIQEAELSNQQLAEELRHDNLYGPLGVFNQLGSDAPLVLSVALSGASSPDEVVSGLISLRQTKEAKRYREWVRRLTKLFDSNDWRAKLEAKSEVDAARKILAVELAKLYGTKSHRVAKAISEVVDAVDVGAIASQDIGSASIPIVKKLASTYGSIRELYLELKVKRRMALVVGLIRESKPEFDLASQIERVFGVSPAKGAIRRFATLRRQQQNLLSRIKS